MQRRKLAERTKTQVAALVVIAIFIILRLFRPNLDPVILILLGLGAVIWIGPKLFKSVVLPGGMGVEFIEDDKETVAAKAKAQEAINQESPAKEPSIKWDKVDTLFWLGNDLMWIEDMTYRYAGPERVLEGVENALRYIQDLGFTATSFPIQELNLAKITLNSLDGLSREHYKQVLQGHYRGIRQHVETVKFYIHSLANIQQPGFNKYTVR